jgi:hypothetical protein
MNSRCCAQPEQSHARGEGQKGGLHGMERQARPLDDDRPELARQEGLLRLMAASPRLQRQCACGAPSAAGGSCAACEAKTPLQGLQHKTLAIGAADDPLELEADQVAERVMRMEVPAEAPLETSWRGGRPMVSRSTDGAAVAGEAPASVHATLTSPGQPLTPAERAFFEPRFGMDFSQVRVHTDDLAQQSARDVHALAYTVGSHVVFGAGRYAPSSTEGQRLLGHELTHVVQQSQAELRVRRKTQEPGVCDPGQLGTLGPDFRKSEADVQKMGLQEKYVIHHPIPDKDFVLYCPHQSTRPLKKLVPCTNVYWIGDAEKSGKGRGKAEVWAQQEGETSLYWGFVKRTNLQDTPCVRTGDTTVEHVRPAPEISKESAICGPEISEELARTLDEVRSKFQAVGPLDQGVSCLTLISLATGGYAWDIHDLTSDGYKEWIDLYQGCATKPCNSSVTVSGQCHFPDTVNFALYGTAMSLCYDFFVRSGEQKYAKDWYSEEAMTKWIKAWKAPKRLVKPKTHEAGATNWATVGWHGYKPERRLSSESELSSCSTKCGKYHGDFTWKWLGLHFHID